MKRVLVTAGAVALGAQAAVAGGLERSTQSVGILFEEGKYAEFNFGMFDPTVSGVFGGVLSSGDMLSSYTTFSFGYKQDLDPRWSVALIVDQPLGADVAYPAASAPYPFAGSSAEVETLGVTGLVRYKFPSNISLYGGLRMERSKGSVNIVAPAVSPAFTNYLLTAEPDTELGYVLGIAWEKPEIAARVALTYNSAIKHTFDTVETGLAPIGLPGNMDVETPQSVNLEFQTGVAADTLVFGSVRWVNWKAFDITPPNLGTAIVSYTSNIVTYNIGVGRRFNETWSGAVTFGYERHIGDPVGNLGPTDGFRSVGVAATYTKGKVKVTGGIRYVDIGSATTTTIGSNFKNNDGWGAGIRVGYSF